MPLLTTPFTMAMTARFVLNACEDLTTFHWLVDGPVGAQPDMTDFMTAWLTQEDAVGGMMGRYVTLLSEDVTGVEWFAQVIAPTRYIRYGHVSVTYNAGTEAGPVMPQNVSVGMTFRGDLAVPAARGTKHIGGVPTSFILDGMVTPTGLGVYLAFADYARLGNSVLVGPDTYTVTPILYHRPDPSASIVVTNAQIGTTSRVARRRTVGLGT